MRELIIEPWRISSEDVDSRGYRESIFSQGNGYMGARGYRPDQRGEHPAWRSTFLAGFFEYVAPGITDMVNQPDFSALQFRLEGTDSEALALSDFVQSLDMRNGLLTWDYVLTDCAGRRTAIRQERLISMANRHTAAIRLSVTALNWEGRIEYRGGIDGSVENLPISDDQMTENNRFVSLWSLLQAKALADGGILAAQTGTSQRKIAMGYVLTGSGTQNTQAENSGVWTVLEGTLRQGRVWRCEKLVAVASFRDGDAETLVREELATLRKMNFEALLKQTTLAWEAIWQDADVELLGDEQWQGAIRYNIFQLVQAMPYGDSRASIGARGLTHGRYKGCYFWDTEIFMLPFFQYTQPEAARTLLEYRYNTLPDALESAKRFSTKGARYAWMSSDTGYEQCGTWDTGCCEVHITADIAHAVGAYFAQTGDESFLRERGAEMLIQTARYWVDRFTYAAAEDRYHLLFVKGPDEYCGVTVDDFYTVSLARDNLELAAFAVAWMQERYAEHWAALAERIGFEKDEVAKWQDIAGKVIRKKDALTGVWQQDATFPLLEPLDVQAHKLDDVPLYHTIGFDRLQRYQVLKQPAVLMYMAMYPERFSREEIQAAWEYYEPKTLHDSTLSFGIHGLIAARLGLEEAALCYCRKSLFLDLRDVMCNTGKEGIHTASLGASWQAVVLGFGGLTFGESGICVRNQLPKQFSGMRFRVWHQGKQYQISIQKREDPQIYAVLNR